MNQFAVSIDIRDDHLQFSNAFREANITQVDGHERRFWIGYSVRFSVPVYLAKNHQSIYFDSNFLTYWTLEKPPLYMVYW